jgi:hypothetical protein
MTRRSNKRSEHFECAFSGGTKPWYIFAWINIQIKARDISSRTLGSSSPAQLPIDKKEPEKGVST